MENGKEFIDFEHLSVVWKVSLLFLLIKTSPISIHTKQSKVIDKQLDNRKVPVFHYLL